MVGSNPVTSFSTKNLFRWSQQSSDMTIDGIYTYTPVPIIGSRRVSQELEFSAVAFNFLSQSLPYLISLVTCGDSITSICAKENSILRIPPCGKDTLIKVDILFECGICNSNFKGALVSS